MRCSPRTLVAVLFAFATVAGGAPLKTSDGDGIISHIRRFPVESKAIAAVGYSKRLGALEIEFRNGAVYRYRAVPPSVYEALMHAASKARFYDENIRRRYRSVHVRPRAE